MHNLRRTLGIVLLLLSIWAVINFSGMKTTAILHAFYIPICLSAWFWGSKAGAVAGAVSGVLSGPLLLHYSTLFHEPQAVSNWLIRTCFFVFWGYLLGYLFTMLRRNQELIMEQNEQLHKQSIESERVGTEIIEAIAMAIEVRDHYTSGHCQRVANMAVEVGKKLGLSPQELVYLRWAGIVHDVGKIGIPEEILNKPGKLTAEEYEIMKRHPVLGAKILSSSRYSEQIISGVRHHHERMDGKGYPDGIGGEQISLQARILAVCDVWDAITSQRSYRSHFSFEAALDIMRSGRGTQFDPRVLDVFLYLIEKEQASGTALLLYQQMSDSKEMGA
ncbi:MAG: hypothetical protein K0R57_2277 [Paenibacillaceae bacterium]|jgi:putative nucleotidyltransferase with HDIG domain|nr:hypothetical protein [Paenibacillaceae bacterium]